MDRSYDLFVKLVGRKVPFLHEVYLREQAEKKHRRRNGKDKPRFTCLVGQFVSLMSAGMSFVREI